MPGLRMGQMPGGQAVPGPTVNDGVRKGGRWPHLVVAAADQHQIGNPFDTDGRALAAFCPSPPNHCRARVVAP